METIAVNLPDILKKEIDVLLDIGYYDDKSEFICDAVRAYINMRSEFKIEIAVELYARDEVSLSRSAEIAKLTTEEMKGFLVSRGIKLRRGYKTLDELTKKTKELRKNLPFLEYLKFHTFDTRQNSDNLPFLEYLKFHTFDTRQNSDNLPFWNI